MIMRGRKFNQAIFIALVDEEIEERGIPQVEIAKAAGLKGSGYNAWRDGRSKIRIEQAMAISEFLGWRPAWALFGEGPKNDEEAAKWDRLQLLIDKLATIPALQAPAQEIPAVDMREDDPRHAPKKKQTT